MPGGRARPSLLREAAPLTEVGPDGIRHRGEPLAAIRAGAAGYLLKSEPPSASPVCGRRPRRAALSVPVAQPAPGARRSDGGVPDDVASVLSAREVEVLLLLDEHLSTEEIAARLFISEHTVRSHVKSLLRKLGVSSRREALERLAGTPA
jgi:DNA-binding NarL/FixJ family response regulator